MKIDPNKKYTTRDGRPVEFLHRAPEGWPSPFPWRGLADGLIITWRDNGRVFSVDVESSSDLVEVREPMELKVSIDKNGITCICYGNGTEEWWDESFPNHAPHRIVTFVEKQLTSETP